MLSRLLLTLFATLVVLSLSKTRRASLQEIADKLNQVIPSFSDNLEVRVKKNNELGIFAKKEIGAEELMFKMEPRYILDSFKVYPRAYYFTELIMGTAYHALTGRIFYETYVNEFETSNFFRTYYLDLLTKLGSSKKYYLNWSAEELGYLEE